jgi:hypothetical protein
MKLEEVLPAMRTGKRIRYDGWRQNIFACLDEHGKACLFKNDKDRVFYTIVDNNEELLEDRWEVFE